MSGTTEGIGGIALAATSNPGQLLEGGGSEKGLRYLAQLYELRCNGQWQEIPEVCRKVEKHAPSRRALALIARAGATVYQDPLASTFQATEKDLGERISLTIQEKGTIPADVLDGRVCRASLLLATGRPEAALGQLSQPLSTAPAPSESNGPEGWMTICILAGTLVRGLALEARRDFTEAANTYRSIISYLSHVVSMRSLSPQLRRWTEELLAHSCLFFSANRGNSQSQLGEAMATFHLLSKYLDGQSWRSLSSQGIFTSHSPRSVWRAYYEALSKIVSDDLVYHPSPIYRDQSTVERRGLLDDDEYAASRLQQRADLRRVEANYETLLLKEIQFPKANERSAEMKSWIDLVMSNWRVLCGPTWTNQELGAGGKAAVARDTLNILYRAATKTFHSTPILRHLFTIHTYLAEFDLAFKAFDSYVEIAMKERARAQKSSQMGLEIDDDETTIRLASEAIRVACRYGSEAHLEIVLDVTEKLLKWLQASMSTQNPMKGEGRLDQEEEGPAPNITAGLPGEVVSLAYRALGISQAQYARATSIPSIRADMQQRSLENLRRSLGEGETQFASAESLYALGMVLAETRDTTTAIRIVKSALNNPDDSESLSNPDGVVTAPSVPPNPLSGNAQQDPTRVKKLLPVWHLLAQLLCAREEFDMAKTCCELALEQLGDQSTLLSGPAETDSNIGSDSKAPSPNRAKRASSDTKSAFTSMDSFEKHTVLEIKMTQLSLLDIEEGPEAAVNTCHELLGLFSRFFGVVDFEKFKRAKPVALLAPPKSSSGTQRSIFGRPRSLLRGHGDEQHNSKLPTTTNSVVTTRPATGTNLPPSIQVVNANGTSTPAAESSEQVERKPRPNTLKKKSSSIRRTNSTRSRPDTSQVSQNVSVDAVDTIPGNHPRVSFNDERQDDEKAQTEKDPALLRPSSHNIHPSKQPAPLGQHEIQPTQDTRLPVSPPQATMETPTPQFLLLQERRHKISLLVKIWLFVARLYHEASLFEDAKEAIEEAFKLVAGLEIEVSQTYSSVKSFQETGWGAGKSVEELWADVYNERGKLYQSQSLPHDAVPQLEQALSHYPDHCEATVALSTILLDIFCQIIPPEKPDPAFESLTETGATLPQSLPAPPGPHATQIELPNASSARRRDPEPSELYRLAVRDRAYGLLSSLTKLGSGWDDPGAWFAMARAYEESGQPDKAKEALWWTIHLEDTKPLRHWRNVSPGGYVL